MNNIYNSSIANTLILSEAVSYLGIFLYRDCIWLVSIPNLLAKYVQFITTPLLKRDI